MRYIMTLENFGIPNSINGYLYLKTAIDLAGENFDLVMHMVSGLYPAVAAACGTTPSRVERSIRYAIEYSWNSKNPMMRSFFKYKPCNSEFIAFIADMTRCITTSRSRSAVNLHS